MVIVQNKYVMRPEIRDGDFIEQGCQNRFNWWWLGRSDRIQDPCPSVGRNRLQRRDQVGQKARRVAISLVQRQPGNRSLAIGDPFADERGLAKTGRGRDKGQFACETVVWVQTLVSCSIRRGRGTIPGRGGGI